MVSSSNAPNTKPMKISEKANSIKANICNLVEYFCFKTCPPYSLISNLTFILIQLVHFPLPLQCAGRGSNGHSTEFFIISVNLTLLFALHLIIISALFLFFLSSLPNCLSSLTRHFISFKQMTKQLFSH